jgi:hypothetical protein
MKNENRDAAVRNTATNTLVIKGVQEIKVGGVTIQVGGGVVEFVGGTLQQPANDTAIAAATKALEIGAKMTDGSIYAGLTTDGNAQIFIMPTDLDVALTFNDAAKAVQKLNSQKAHGHDDWQIPNKDTLQVLQKNKNEGALKGTFKTAASSSSDNSGWYWSPTEHRGCPSSVWVVRFSDGYEVWNLMDCFRLSCRPTRLVGLPRGSSNRIVSMSGLSRSWESRCAALLRKIWRR